MTFKASFLGNKIFFLQIDHECLPNTIFGSIPICLKLIYNWGAMGESLIVQLGKKSCFGAKNEPPKQSIRTSDKECQGLKNDDEKTS